MPFRCQSVDEIKSGHGMPFSIELENELSVENIEEFALARVYVARRPRHRRGHEMEECQRSIGVLCRHFHERLLADNVQRCRRAPVASCDDV